MRRRDEIVLWPAYFDLTKTRSQGRRVPKKLAKANPSVDDIAKALQSLNVPHRIVPDAAYPRIPYERKGMILVKKVMPKNKFIKEVAAKIESSRSISGARKT
ncbi:signal recognition particle protein Srp19 [Candidatus Bathyarchaeota archaeon]|nr:MAG: signal recognition particle protein Srp19 [Candidatus Bathyarchaeota archaeon]